MAFQNTLKKTAFWRMSDIVISYLNKVFNIFTRLKGRQWANKEKSLVIDEIIIILISGVLAYIIVSLLPAPEKRVPFELITFEKFLSFFPRSFTSIFRFFQAIANFFANISIKLRNILGPFWDIIMFIPSKIIGFAQFIITCLLTFIKNFLELFYNFFSMVFSPFQSFLKIFSSIGNLFNRFISIFLKIPGISHLIRLIGWIIDDIIILLSSFFALFTQLGKILRSFDINKFLLSLKNLRFFNFIGSIFNFIFRFFEWLFRVTIWRLLSIFKLSDFIGKFFLNIGHYIIKFFNFLFVNLLNIPKFLKWLSLKLAKLEIRFPNVAGLRDILIGLFNIMEWIILFPFFLLLKFLGFFSYILRSLTFEGIRNWWNNLCQEPGGCRDMNINVGKLMEQLKDVNDQLDAMKAMLANLTQPEVINSTVPQ